MNKISTLAQTDAGMALERSENKFTIRSANVALEMARLKGQAEEVAIALIHLAHLH